MYQAMTGLSGRGQGRGCGKGRECCRGVLSGQKQPSDPYICHLCGQRGHWRIETSPQAEQGDRKRAAAVFMSSDSIYCTTRVSEGPDKRSEEVWNRRLLEVKKLCLPWIFWKKDTPATLVSLSHSQDELFDGVSPHVLLAKPAHWELKDL